MSWSPLRFPLSDLLLLQARMARLQLVQKIGAAEMHLRAAGLDAAPLARARRELLAQPLVGRPTGFVVPPPPPPPMMADGTPRLRYLLVKEGPHV